MDLRKERVHLSIGWVEFYYRLILIRIDYEPFLGSRLRYKVIPY